MASAPRRSPAVLFARFAFSAVLLLLTSPAFAQTRPVLEPQLGHGSGINALAFSPNGKLLATASSDSTVILWDVTTGLIQRRLKGGGGRVAFSRDGLTLLSASDDNIIIVWDLSTGQVRSRRKAQGCCGQMALSPDNRTIAVGNDDGSVVVWDLQTWKELKKIKAHSRQAIPTFSPDGQMIASFAEDGNVVLWDGTTQRSLNNSGSKARCVAFSPNGRLLAWGKEDGTVTLWDGKTAQSIKGHMSAVNSVAFSPDGRTLASGGGDKVVILLDLASGTARDPLKHATDVSHIAFSPDGKALASVIAGNDLIFWDVATGQSRPAIAAHYSSINSVAFSPDGRWLATGILGGRGVIWDTSTGEAPRPVGRPCCAFSPNGQLLATDSPLIEVATGGEKASLRNAHTLNISCTAFSRDGRVLATGSEDKTIVLHDGATGVPLTTLRGHEGNVTSMAFAPDGRTLASGGIDSKVILWDSATGSMLDKLSFEGGVRSVAFSPNGKVLAAGGGRAVILWDSATGKRLKLSGHTAEVRSIAFSPDGRTLASASEDMTVVLWDLGTGKPRKVLASNTSGFTSVAYSPDGARLAAGCNDGTVRLWNASSGAPLATLVSINETSDWLITTPQGFYNRSDNSARFMRWRVGGWLYPVETFEETFNRTDLVAKALRGEPLPSLAQVERFALGGEPIPPYVAFVTPRDGQEITGDFVEVSLYATDDVAVAGVVLLVNGRPTAAKPITADARPITADAKPITADAKPIPANHKTYREFRITAPLPPGEPTITLKAIAYDDEGLQGWDAIHLTRKGAAPVVGDLYVLAVGVSEYQKPAYNLKYAASDAQAFAGLWSRTEGTLYRRVITVGLTDAQATSANVRAALQRLTETATDKDSVILFLSGHGILFTEKNEKGEAHEEYYFATHEVDPAGKTTLDKTAVRWTLLQDTLAKVRAKRVLMFLDACHSGSTLGGTQASNDRLARLLAKAGGVMVFSSSRGSQFSYELDEKKHGAFTTALMEGIGEGKADRAPSDGSITPIELLAWLQERVPQLTANLQMPACPFLSDFGEPFPLAR